jgi:hypothetical protein
MHDSKRQASSSSSNPIGDVSLLSHVLSYVGPGQNLFVSLVSKLWLETYDTIPDLLVASLVSISIAVAEAQVTQF